MFEITRKQVILLVTAIGVLCIAFRYSFPPENHEGNVFGPGGVAVVTASPVIGEVGNTLIPRNPAVTQQVRQVQTVPIPPTTEQPNRKVNDSLSITSTRSGRPRWQSILYTPTHITKLDGVWFIVDCWHHRILHHTNVDAPIELWASLDPTDEGATVKGIPTRKDGPAGGGIQHALPSIPHSIATDGTFYIVESSKWGSKGKDHGIIVFTKSDDWTFKVVQELTVSDDNRAKRPHRAIYDGAFTKSFFVYMTNPPHLARFMVDKQTNSLTRLYCEGLPFMKGAYARSIYVHLDGLMYITSGPKGIWSVNHSSPTGVTPVKFYPVGPLHMKVMNDLLYADGWWYASSTVPCGIKRFRDINQMKNHEDLAQYLGLCGINRGKSTGTPYFLQVVEGRLYVPYIFTQSGVVSFSLSSVRNSLDELRKPGVVKHHWKQGGWEETPEDAKIRDGPGLRSW
eukprot:PhF_6_TR26123/c0_g1_i2/m.36968